MLVTLKEILQEAKKEQRAVGAFNVPNLESVMAVTQAAEEEQVPVILQHALVHESLITLPVIGPIMLDFARRASVPVAVHLDHGASFEGCVQAIRLGFTSVMYDASLKSFEDNLRETSEVVRIAHAAGVSVEAELGRMPASEIGGGEGRAAAASEDMYTDPAQAEEFAARTGVDALAISFGTVHGVYVTEPVLNLERISEIAARTDTNLVMHGGSGVTPQDFHRAILNGITKINYFTYMSLAGGRAAKELVASCRNELFFHDLCLAGISSMRDNCRSALRVFNRREA